MLKLKLQNLDDKGYLIDTIDCGTFRSYKDIGAYLYRRGRIGKYYVIPNNISNLGAIKEINVTRDKYGKQIEIQGSLY